MSFREFTIWDWLEFVGELTLGTVTIFLRLAAATALAVCILLGVGTLLSADSVWQEIEGVLWMILAAVAFAVSVGYSILAALNKMLPLLAKNNQLLADIEAELIMQGKSAAHKARATSASRV